MKSQPMKPTISIGLAALAGLFFFQTGCSVLSPKADHTKLYILRAKSTPPAATAESKAPARAVRLGPGRVAAYLDVTPVVVQDGPNRVKQLDLHHWAEPLPKGISRVFSENLSQRLNGAQIIVYPEPATGVIRNDGQEGPGRGTFWRCTFEKGVYIEVFMKDERPFSKSAHSLDERFADDPVMRERLHQIADMRDRMLAQGVSLDEVEARTVEQIRLLGQELLGSIAQAKADQSAAAMLEKDRSAIRDRKKK